MAMTALREEATYGKYRPPLLFTVAIVKEMWRDKERRQNEAEAQKKEGDEKKRE